MTSLQSTRPFLRCCSRITTKARPLCPLSRSFTAGRSSTAPETRDDRKKTHFGFKTVDFTEKASKVAEVFSSVADKYDVMNDLMSMGLHRPWKSRFVSLLNPGRLPGSPNAQQILDVAGGTGDISYRILEHMTDINRDVESRVLCTDINPDMLREGERRLQTDPSLARWKDRIEFRVENAETLESIPDNSIDIYTVSFGIRNVTDIPKALRTAHRVLKPGGVLGVLEFSRVKPWILDEIYQRYSFSVIPVMGQIVAGDRDSYQYLVESIRMFPSQARFAEMIEEAGFELPVGKPYEELTFGVANIWRGIKL